MKRNAIKRGMPVLLVFCLLWILLAAGLGMTTASAAQDERPLILCHGIMGYGPDEGITKLLGNYYGSLAEGDLAATMRKNGQNVYEADVSPLGSVWDRACELYACIKGGTVDYGAAHSAKYGHDRYGKTYDGLYTQWSNDNPVDVLGHSLGGPTVRLLAYLLYYGDAEEQAAGGDVSPLFTGSGKNMIFSVTTLAGDNNGTTLFDIFDDTFASLLGGSHELSDEAWIKVFQSVGWAWSQGELPELWDPQMDAWGMKRESGESITDYLNRLINSEAFKTRDIAYFCAGGDAMKEFNDTHPDNPNCYYFAIPTCATMDLLGGPQQVADPTYAWTTWYAADAMGIKKVDDFPGGWDDSYYANDGLMNTVLAKGPFVGGSSTCVDYTEGTALQPGIWYNMPTIKAEHLGVTGTYTALNKTFDILDYYTDHYNLLHSLGSTGTASSLRYDDVSTSDWFYEAVEYVSGRSIMTGTSDRIFSPQTNLSRAMVVQMIYALEGRPSVSGAGQFSDVSSGAWYADAVAWASSRGIVAGYSDGTFRPDQDVTREELAVILNRYAETIGASSVTAADLSGFSDADAVSSWAKDSVQWAVGAGLIAGRDGKQIAPQGTATRAEAAQMFMNFCKKFGK